jgi:PKD repeat protein
VYAVAGNYSATLVVSNTCGDDSLITVQIVVGCIGIEPFTITEAQVFFNQNIGSLIFSFPPDGARYNLIIYDQLGQVVKTFSTQESSFQWDVTNLSSGVYFIETEGAKGKKVTRFVK